MSKTFNIRNFLLAPYPAQLIGINPYDPKTHPKTKPKVGKNPSWSKDLSAKKGPAYFYILCEDLPFTEDELDHMTGFYALDPRTAAWQVNFFTAQKDYNAKYCEAGADIFHVTG